MAINESRQLEILVSKIQKQLAPDAEVLHNVRLPGRHSKRDRQVDVLVRKKIGQYEMLIVLDCKDYAKPVDVKGVEEFYGLLKDVGAHKGALVCPRGFSAAAKERATGLQIDLYSPVDTDPHKWRVRVTVPTVFSLRTAAMSFEIVCDVPMPLRLPEKFWSETVAMAADGRKLGTPWETAMKKWNGGRFPTNPGEYSKIDIFDEPVVVDNGYNNVVPVKLTVGLTVWEQLYFGQLSIARISGFKDEFSGKIITNAFTVGIMTPDELEKKWLRIESEAQLPMPAVIEMVGFVGCEMPQG
jgi:Restriction endonuclease